MIAITDFKSGSTGIRQLRVQIESYSDLRMGADEPIPRLKFPASAAEVPVAG
jgi:hypothetical protein